MMLKSFFQLIWFLWLIEPLAATPSLVKPGCKYACGNVSIPYPFGIGAGCFLNEWYEVLCVHDRPYLREYYGQEFLGPLLYVSLDDSTIIANYSKNRVCEDKGVRLAGNFSGSPFFFDDTNKFIIFGCGNVTLFGDQIPPPPHTTGDQILGGCTSTCDGYNGISSHCQFTVQYASKHYYLDFSNVKINRSNSCDASVILVTELWRPDPSENPVGASFPIKLGWTLSEFPNEGMNCNPNYDYGGYSCACPDCTEGNAYISNGCQVSSGKPYCASTSHSKKRLIVLAVCGTSIGILFLAATSFLLYKSISKRKDRKLKEKFFKRNGGLLLQQQLSVDESIVDKVRFFTSSELDKATDYFNENRVLGHGGQGTVYKGMLIDGKIIAVKKSKLADNNQVEQFINEIVVLSQINHRNVVKLLGCCLETNVPLLVYEFIPNGTLYDLIHNESDEFFMSWDMRLRIAIEVAGALAYLHSATSVPIYHRDIKSSNILLDEKHKAKVSDFGISRHVTIDQTHLTTMVKGTFGYLDPEYFQSYQFTEKSDVYSFGIVLVELLTRQKPICSTRSTIESCLSLATRFLISMEEDQLNMILDAQILNIASDKQVEAVAILAQRCLSLDGKKRPTMKEVALGLESIKMFHLPSTTQTNFQDKKGVEIEPVLFSDGISSSTAANDTIASSSDAYPLLSDNF